MDEEQLRDILPQWQKTLMDRHRVEQSFFTHAHYWFDPLVDSLAGQQASAGRPLLVALNGAQGSGKSTLCAYLEMAIAVKYQIRAVTLSLDDFYLTRDQRAELGREVHPLLATRGVPGTHDMALLETTLDQLLHPTIDAQVKIPRFDKANDDRFVNPEVLSGAVDLVLLEGWCVGAEPQPLESLVEPVNELERLEDPDGLWRNYVNAALASSYLPLYERVDQWVMLQAPSFDCVSRWRLEQEKILAQVTGSKPATQLMDEQQIERFVQFFQRLTEACLNRLPGQVDYLYVLDESRRVCSQK